MAQIRNRFDIQNSMLEEEITSIKKLPNFFDTQDEIKPINGLLLSVLTHIVFSFLLIIIVALQGLVFPHLPKPNLMERDVEFKLVQNESKPPINKKTKIRSDRDSQAGGKHDPRKAISEPSPKKSAPSKKAISQKAQPQKVAKKPVVKKQINKVMPSKPQVTKPTPKPSPIKAPSMAKPAKPVNKPSSVARPSAPKIATAPKSPFKVAVPPSKAPVGHSYRPSTTQGVSKPASSGEYSPSPKFSSSGGYSGGSSHGAVGSSGGKYSSRGSSGGYGAGGNPSPGNPYGAPGIDAIRQPNWGPYMRDLEQRIKRNWTPPKGDTSKRVVIEFAIGRDGRLLSHKVTKSSGVALVDRAAMSAIELSAPFRLFPPEYREPSVMINFTFDYNVLNSVLR